MRYAFRPLPAWADPETTARRSGAVFRAKWDTTLKQLVYEAEQLGADLVVVQVVVAEADLRQDGMLRTKAVVLTDPAARQRAWRAAARKHHPDVAGDDPAATELFRRAKAAKDLLDQLGGDA